MTTIYVLCPPYIKTGGTELSHQLVYLLNTYGKKAHIAYFQAQDDKYIHPAFKQYVDEYILINKIEDIPDNIVVIPEGMTEYLKMFSQIQKYVWWMSVDNYFRPLPLKMAYQNNGIDQLCKELVKRIVRAGSPKCTPINQMGDVVLHLVQSKYAEEFLKRNGIHNIAYLSDYINDIYFTITDKIKIENKKNVVLYNPKKGKRFTKKVISYCKNIEFVPIQNMNNEQIINIMSESKIYMDFGNHPGKDRMPREAAMMKCCIITGIQGSAKYYEDVMIDSKYKFEDANKSLKSINETINYIFEHFSDEIVCFEEYRNKISKEKALFEEQIHDIFIKQ